MMESMIYVVGIGPGDKESMTGAAETALREAEVILGYTVYVDLIRPLFPEKEFLSTPMKKETERCTLAFQEAEKGRCVAMVCSGDAGVYGMAGLLLEMQPAHPEVTIEIVPGITAALSGAAVLGAPLTNDFCVISLSDHLTPWEDIQNRLSLAAQGDFAICLYNPMSKTRPEHLKRACELLLSKKAPDTPCGYVRNIGRAGQESKILTLRELPGESLDMFTTVFIGTKNTEVIANRLVTRRGYR